MRSMREMSSVCWRCSTKMEGKAVDIHVTDVKMAVCDCRLTRPVTDSRLCYRCSAAPFPHAILEITAANATAHTAHKDPSRQQPTH